eukprot:3569262-Prymnesium_polylepis.2
MACRLPAAAGKAISSSHTNVRVIPNAAPSPPRPPPWPRPPWCPPSLPAGALPAPPRPLPFPSICPTCRTCWMISGIGLGAADMYAVIRRHDVRGGRVTAYAAALCASSQDIGHVPCFSARAFLADGRCCRQRRYRVATRAL